MPVKRPTSRTPVSLLRRTENQDMSLSVTRAERKGPHILIRWRSSAGSRMYDSEKTASITKLLRSVSVFGQCHVQDAERMQGGKGDLPVVGDDRTGLHLAHPERRLLAAHLLQVCVREEHQLLYICPSEKTARTAAGRTDKDLGPREWRDLDGDALLPVGTEDLDVLARVGYDDKMCRCLGEHLFAKLASSSAPARRAERERVSAAGRVILPVELRSLT